VNSPVDNNTILYNYVNATCTGAYDEAWETTTVISAPELHITKESIPLYVEAGSVFSYRIRITNTGTMRATNVTVQESYDDNVTFISASPSPTSGNNIWIIGELDVGNFYEININVRVQESVEEGAIIHNYVNVTCDQNSSDEAEIDTYVVFYPPETHKQFNGEVINITLWDDDNGVYILHYIPIDTTISLVATDNGSGINITYYRIFKWVGYWTLLFNWQGYGIWRDYPPYCPINLSALAMLYNLSPCGKYEIEFYSVDNAGNMEEVKWNDVFVDCIPPISEIEEIVPYDVGGINVSINVVAEDFGVGIEKVELYYRYSEDNLSWSNWVLYGEKTSNFSWQFNASNYGYYEFYSVAYDMFGNHEDTPNASSTPKARCKISYPWDVNGDGKVNIEDILFVVMYWGKREGDEGWNPKADVNNDDIVNVSDLIEIVMHWTG